MAALRIRIVTYMAATTFLSDYVGAGDIARFSAKPTKSALLGRCLVMDYPIRDVDRFIAVAMLRLNAANMDRFAFIVANEGAAIVAAMLAAGYTPMEVIGLRESGSLDPVQLIESKQVITGRFHRTKKGAEHKGRRLRDAVDKLIRDKIGGDPAKDVTLAELHSAGKRVPLYITALNLATAAIEKLSWESYPNMPVADAVLASCAVQPYIAQVEHDGKAFISCSMTQSLPFASAQQIFAARGIQGNLGALLVGYGCKKAENTAVAGASSTTGSDVYKCMLAQRAAPVFPDQVKQNVHLL